MNAFRCLRADEIECRVQQVKDNGLILLLYKDARCDMNILDETVGAMNWTREHRRDNANCVVSIWDSEKGQWVSKEDTGILHRLSGSRQETTPPTAASAMTNSRSRRSSTRRTPTAPTVTKS